MVDFADIASFAKGAAPYAQREVERRQAEETRLEALNKQKKERDMSEAERVRVLRAQEAFDAELDNLNSLADENEYSPEIYNQKLQGLQKKHSGISGVNELRATTFQTGISDLIRKSGNLYENKADKVSKAYADAKLSLDWSTQVNGIMNDAVQGGYAKTPQELEEIVAQALSGALQPVEDGSKEGETRGLKFRSAAARSFGTAIRAYTTERKKKIKEEQISKLTQISALSLSNAAKVVTATQADPDLTAAEIAEQLSASIDVDGMREYAEALDVPFGKYYPVSTQNAHVATILGALFREKHPNQSTDTDTFDVFLSVIRKTSPEKMSTVLNNVLGEDTGGQITRSPGRLNSILANVKTNVESFRPTTRLRKADWTDKENKSKGFVDSVVRDLKVETFSNVETGSKAGQLIARLASPFSSSEDFDFFAEWDQTGLAGNDTEFDDVNMPNRAYKNRRDKLFNAVFERREIVRSVLNGNADWDEYSGDSYDNVSLMQDALRFKLGPEEAEALADPKYFNNVTSSSFEAFELNAIMSDHKFLPPSLFEWIDRYQYDLEQGRQGDASTGELQSGIAEVRTQRPTVVKNLQKLQSNPDFMKLPSSQREELASAIKDLRKKGSN
jgi:hypothetical protein